MGKSLDDLFEEVAAETAAAYDKNDTPDNRARIATKRQAEFERGVRLGWHDANGDPMPGADTGEDDETEEGDDE